MSVRFKYTNPHINGKVFFWLRVWARGWHHFEWFMTSYDVFKKGGQKYPFKKYDVGYCTKPTTK